LAKTDEAPGCRKGQDFDGCNVAGESEGLLEFMEAVDTPVLQAFAISRLWWSDEYVIPNGADAGVPEGQ
jgi:hypothetical protein